MRGRKGRRRLGASVLSFSNNRKRPFTLPSPHMWGGRLRFFFFFRFFSFPFAVFFFSSSHLFEVFYVGSVFQLGYIRVSFCRCFYCTGSAIFCFPLCFCCCCKFFFFFCSCLCVRVVFLMSPLLCLSVSYLLFITFFFQLYRGGVKKKKCGFSVRGGGGGGGHLSVKDQLPTFFFCVCVFRGYAPTTFLIVSSIRVSLLFFFVFFFRLLCFCLQYRNAEAAKKSEVNL